LRTRAIPERLRGVITSRRYINPPLSYFTLPKLVSGRVYIAKAVSVSHT